MKVEKRKTQKMLEVECAELDYMEQSLCVGIAEYRRKIAELEEKRERIRETRSRLYIGFVKVRN